MRMFSNFFSMPFSYMGSCFAILSGYTTELYIRVFGSCVSSPWNYRELFKFAKSFIYLLNESCARVALFLMRGLWIPQFLQLFTSKKFYSKLVETTSAYALTAGSIMGTRKTGRIHEQAHAVPV